MEVPRGLVYRSRPSHGVHNAFDRPYQSRAHRTSYSPSYLTYGPPLGDTALHTMGNWMFSSYTRENPVDHNVHDMHASMILSQDTGDLPEGYWLSHCANLRDRVPSHNQIWSPPGVNGLTQGNHALATDIYQGDAYFPEAPYPPYLALSTSTARLNQVAGQLPLPIRPNDPLGGAFPPGTSSTSSQGYPSPQSRSGRDPMHG